MRGRRHRFGFTVVSNSSSQAFPRRSQRGIAASLCQRSPYTCRCIGIDPIVLATKPKYMLTVTMCVLPRSHWGRCTAIMLFTISALNVFADANSWLKPTSGNWEEPQWSQGILPNYGHAVMITNAGWKAVQIAPSTAQNFPDSLTVYSITVASPVDSFNTLLVNYAGFDRPVTVNYNLTIGPGAAMNILSSALRLNGPPGVGLSVGGEFNQNDNSQVIGNQGDVGWVGPGVYNFNSGLIQLQHLFVGGPNHGIFNQNGGSNSPGIVHFENGGIYNLRDGDFNGTTYTSDGTVFRQDGGRVHSLLEFHGGQYILNNGTNYGGVSAPVYGNYERGYASVIQNGGAIYGPVTVGGEVQGGGSYTLSNGVISAPSIAVGMLGDFHQLGGTVTTPGTIGVHYGRYIRSDMRPGKFTLDGGSLSCGGLQIDVSSFTQNGGTNQIAGNLTFRGTWYGTTEYELHNGLLTTENTWVQEATSGGFFQSGGTHRVAQVLYISSSRSQGPFWRGYEMSGGQLILTDLSVFSGGTFRQTGGTLTQSGGTLLDTGNLFPGPGTQQFGALQLSQTNNLTMPSGASSLVRFQNSSAMVWLGTNTFLIVSNWAGSTLGGGAHRIIFGNSSAALTPQQVAKISFRNPANFAYGTYPAKILPSGEIVPDGVPPTGHNPSRLAIRKLPDSTVQITVTADPGYNYGVLTSDDLINWSFWTNRVATSGSFTVVDPNNVEWWPWRRFYKAVLMQ